MSNASLFEGLTAFPITPTDEHYRVDTELLGRLLERLCYAGVDSIGFLGSTGIYAYLTLDERKRALAVAIEVVKGRVPIIVGVGALRTDDAVELATHARTSGADAVLMAPMSYTPLMDDEAYQHYRAVAAAADLPLCIYNNPGTTHFSFNIALLEKLSRIEQIEAVKMPLPNGANFTEELAILRERTNLKIGYSGDWGMVDAMLGGADAFYSVLGGTLPSPTVAVMRAAQAGRIEEARKLGNALEPVWNTFKSYGSIRVMYAIVEILGLGRTVPPRPILPLDPDARSRVETAIMSLQS